MEYSKRKVKAHVLADTESDPELSDSSSSESDSSADSNYSKSKRKKRDKKKKRQNHKKQDSSDSLSSNSDSSDDSEYIRKRHKNKNHWKNDPIKLCKKLTEKLLTTTYKSKIIKFKLDKDLLQRRIFFLTFLESLDIIFPSIKKLVNYYYIIPSYFWII